MAESCGRQHLGYLCTRERGHDGLHQSRGRDGILRHSWAPKPAKPRKAVRRG